MYDYMYTTTNTIKQTTTHNELRQRKTEHNLARRQHTKQNRTNQQCQTNKKRIQQPQTWGAMCCNERQHTALSQTRDTTLCESKMREYNHTQQHTQPWQAHQS